MPALLDLGAALKGRRVAPFELFDAARKSLHFVGYEGLSAIAVAGVDMAAWDALARAANMPLCVLLGGSVGAVKSYNSNGLWLQPPDAVAAEALELRDEGGFTGLKLRLGRESVAADLATLDVVRRAVGDEMHLMVDILALVHVGALVREPGLDRSVEELLESAAPQDFGAGLRRERRDRLVVRAAQLAVDRQVRREQVRRIVNLELRRVLQDRRDDPRKKAVVEIDVSLGRQNHIIASMRRQTLLDDANERPVVRHEGCDIGPA